MPEQLGLVSSVSIALGGMIGGGIFAVLGVVAKVAGSGAWLAFIAAGIVAACAGYSYARLNAVSECVGGSVSFVQYFVGNTTAAGMVGWTLLFGYVGSMAMYAHAFGTFAVELFGLPAVIVGAPLRPIVSAAAVALFVGLNLLGARATGTAENVLVAAKVGILLLFAGWGAIYGLQTDTFDAGLSVVSGLNSLTAAALSFVAFQGWQLLFYDRESIRDPDVTIPRAMYVAIGIAVSIYALVAVVTTSFLAPETILQRSEVALAIAARPFMGEAGFALISVAALVSTGSAINATLFSAAHFAKGMLSEDLLPDRVGDDGADGIPERTVILLGLVTVGFTVYGSLDGVTTFASLSFIVVFGLMSALAFTQRHENRITAVIPAVGVAGSLLFAPLLFSHLYRNEPNTFGAVVLTSLAVFLVELGYFERDKLRREIEIVKRGWP